MHRIKLTLIFCLFCLFGFAQQKKKGKIPSPPLAPPSAADYDVLEKRMACLYRNKYQPAERLKFFPFNQYKKVMLISFEPPDISADIMITDNIEAKVKAPFKAEVHQPLLAKHQKLDPARLKEKKILSALELNKLTNVLYNFGSTSTEPYKGLLLPADEGYRCYNPRNAIVFLNEKGIIGEYIEICFECHRNEVSSEEIKMGEFCNEKYKLIKEYFYARGIKYGTGKNVD